MVQGAKATIQYPEVLLRGLALGLIVAIQQPKAAFGVSLNIKWTSSKGVKRKEIKPLTVYNAKRLEIGDKVILECDVYLEDDAFQGVVDLLDRDTEDALRQDYLIRLRESSASIAQ